MLARLLYLLMMFLLALFGGTTTETEDDASTGEGDGGTTAAPSSTYTDPGCTGDVLVQAEDLVSSSDDALVETCADCDGGEYVSGLDAGEWFDLEVDVDALDLYDVQLAAASGGGDIEIQRVTDDGALTLAVIDMPNTSSALACSPVVKLALPAGTQTLRIKSDSTTDGVDYAAITGPDSSLVDVVTLTVNDGPGINPLKGWNSGWWVDSDFSSVGFQYIEWGTLEPEDNKFDWEAVEAVLDRPGSKGRHLILQFVVDWDWAEKVEDNYKGPDWLLDEVDEFTGTDPWNPTRKMRATDYNDPEFIAQAEEAIKALNEYFEDDPRAFVIQVGLLGFWGEWHTFPRTEWSPTDATKTAIFESYQDNRLDNVMMQARYPQDSITVPTDNMGYTNGSATLTDHGKEFNTNLQDEELWDNGPIGGEWPPNVDLKHWKPFFDGSDGLDYILDGHYSTLLPPSPEDLDDKVPGWDDADSTFMEHHREFGYNFHVDQVRQVHEGTDGPLLVEVDLTNDGIARFYIDWDVQLAVLDSDDAVVATVDLDADMRTWTPDSEHTLTAYLDADWDADASYRVGLRLLQPGADDKHDEEWLLNARNTYIVLSNDIDVVEGSWNSDTNGLVGGWNVLADVGADSSE